MGSTSKMGIPYPAATDYVSDGATDMQAIADQVDVKTGLVFITSGTISGSTTNFVGCFPTDFKLFKLYVYNVRSAANVTPFGFRLLANTTPASTSYATQRAAVQSTLFDGINSTLTYAQLGYTGSNAVSVSSYEALIVNPNTTKYTTTQSLGVYNDNSNSAYIEQNHSTHRVATAYDGLQMFNNGSTFSEGTVIIFGING